jgi:CRP-like cAMP-binding protein
MFGWLNRRKAREAAQSLGLELTQRFAEDTIREFDDGDIIFSEGDDSREMYIVIEGEVAITKRSQKGEIALASFKRGDFVGEMSLLESLPRSASARAKGKTRLLAIHPGGFLLKIRRDPTFAFEMMQALSRRIRTTNEALMKELNRATANPDSIRKILQGSEFTGQDQPTAQLPAPATAEASVVEIHMVRSDDHRYLCGKTCHHI